MRNQKKKGIFENYIPDENGKVSILLYGDIGEGNRVDPESIVSQLIELSNKYTNIELHINSNGGDVFSGIAIFSALKNSQANISIHVDGVAASMAGVIALCGKPVYMSKYARLMLHRVAGMTYGGVQDLTEAINQMQSLENDLADILSSRCKMTHDVIKSTYFNGDNHWFTAQQALDAGLIDGISDVPLGYIDEKEISNNNPEEIYNAFNNRFEARNKTPNLLSRIKRLPAFSNIKDEEEVLNHLKRIQPTNVSTILENAYKKGLITLHEKEEMFPVYQNNTNLLSETLSKRERKQEIDFENQYDEVVKGFGYSFCMKNQEFINNELKLFAKSNFGTFKKLAQCKKGSLLVSDYIILDESGEKDKGRSDWTLDDYRKHAPNELRKNPELYESLLNKK